MIKIKPEVPSTFNTPVKLTPFGGEAESVNIEYLYMPVSEAMELANKKTIGEMLAEIIKGWDGIEASFTTESLAELLDYNPAMGLELFNGFFAGLAESRAKN